jgi:hypothetical protein
MDDTWKTPKASLPQVSGSSPNQISASQRLEDELLRPEELRGFAIQRATILFKQFRHDPATDPETFIAGIAAVLARYSRSIVTVVTSPGGLAAKLPHGFPPNQHEVREECERLAEMDRRAAERARIVEATLRDRATAELKSREKLERSTEQQLDEQFERLGLSHLRTQSSDTKTQYPRPPGSRANLQVDQGRPGYEAMVAKAQAEGPSPNWYWTPTGIKVPLSWYTTHNPKAEFVKPKAFTEDEVAKAQRTLDRYKAEAETNTSL